MATKDDKLLEITGKIQLKQKVLIEAEQMLKTLKTIDEKKSNI